MINFTIYGEPTGKGRPRFRRMGNYVSTYTDNKTANYETLVKFSYLEKYNNFIFNEEDYLRVSLNCYFTRQKNISKKNKELYNDNIIRPNKKPDIDNIIKSILDGLNKTAFYDDKQIVEIEVKKWYVEIDKQPRVEVEIEKL